MPSLRTSPVEDSVPRINNEIAVGEDLEFQRRWWRFENILWIFLVAILALDVTGLLGRGYLAKGTAQTKDGAMVVKYERIERFKTPSILTIQFGPSALQNGKLILWTSDSLVKDLGAQRVIPQPEASVIGEGGLRYVFDATPGPSSVQFALEPGKIGLHHLTLRVPGSEDLKLDVAVLP
ncbi:MAG TPA: hypothetical protein VLJ11_00440 [Bryobacteraceae bacterium]|nr:hypothetical protein [Bryobacteraceae bacterium]